MRELHSKDDVNVCQTFGNTPLLTADSQSQPTGWNFNRCLVDAHGKVVRH